MRQVLFHIPLKAEWLPANFPLPLLVLVVGLALAGVISFISRRVERAGWKENLRGTAVWIGGFSVLLAGGMFFLANKFQQGLPIYGFGMMLFLAFLICSWLANRRGESEGISSLLIQDVTLWLFIGGLIGARFVFLKIEQNMSFAEMFQKFYQIWDGGIVLYGSVLGGLIAYGIAYYLSYRKIGLSTWKMADILAPSIAVGICLGRFGCFLNGCCYGQVVCPTCPAFAVHFPLSAPAREGLVEQGYQTAAGFTIDRAQPHDLGARVGQVEPNSLAYEVGLRPHDLIVKANDCVIEEKDIEENGRMVHLMPVDVLTRCLIYQWPRGKTQLFLTVKHGKDAEEIDLPPIEPQTLGLHPTQIYEVVSMALLFLVLTAYYPLRRRHGQVMALLMVGYGIHRYLNELLRDDPRPVGFERYTSLVLVVAGVALWVYFQKQPQTLKSGRDREEAIYTTAR